MPSAYPDYRTRILLLLRDRPGLTVRQIADALQGPCGARVTATMLCKDDHNDRHAKPPTRCSPVQARSGNVLQRTDFHSEDGRR